MTVSINRIVGSLIYRTREALNNNSSFLSAIEAYEFYDNCFIDNKFSLWHYPGTHGEISANFLTVSDTRLKFPSLLNFQPVREEVLQKQTTAYLNLAFLGLTKSDWCTEEREAQVFDLLLMPVYSEFLNQIAKCRYFSLQFGEIQHQRYRVFTTGKDKDGIVDFYHSYIDALELHNLKLQLKPCYTDKLIKQINYENNLVTELFNT